MGLLNLYVGPNEEKNLIEWCYILNIANTEKILKIIKNSKKYKQSFIKENDIKVLLKDWNDVYCLNLYQLLEDKLEKLNLKFVFTHNMEHIKFKIGREIKNKRENIQNDIELFKIYNLNVEIFYGLNKGNIIIDCNFPY